MNKLTFAERIGNLDDRLVRQAEELPDYRVRRRQKGLRRLLATAAVFVLMVSSFGVGASAFPREVIVEVPAEQECLALEDIDLTVLFPDSWKGRYTVVESTFVPNHSTMWEICVKSVYDANRPADEHGEVFYRGTLFTIFQYADHSMSAEEFAEDELAGIGHYLFATEQATYAVLYATDVQYDPMVPEQARAYQDMLAEIREVRFVVERALF